MNSNKILQIGVMIGNVHTQHPMELIRGICNAAKDEQVNITFFLGAQGNALDYWSGNTDENDLSAYSYQYNSLYDYSLITGLDALIISYGTLGIYLDRDDRQTFTDRFRNVPLVILEEYDEASPDSFLISDNYGSMYAIVEHLLKDHGYRKILYLSGPKNNTDADERLRAYRDAMQAYGLSADASMIEFGDYSSDVEPLVERLLDRYPDAEAIVSANDEMALSIYRVCKKRGLRPGRDLAVTGYDNVDFAQRLDPPLTTANQDGLEMGYRALKCALSLCRDPRPIKMKLPAQFLRRQSCGCRIHHAEADTIPETLLDRIRSISDEAAISDAAAFFAKQSLQGMILDTSLDHGKEYFTALLCMLLSLPDEGNTNEKHLTEQTQVLIRNLCEREGDLSLDFIGFSRSFHRIISAFITRNGSKEGMESLEKVLNITDTYITSYLMCTGEDNVKMLLNKSWTAPATIQYMIEKVEDENAFHRLTLENTISQGAKSAYLFLTPEPLLYDRKTPFVCPERLELAAKYTDGRLDLYEKKNRPIATQKDGFSSYYPPSPEHTYVAFILFARTYQYGIMLCEIDASLIGVLYGVTLQISTAMAYKQISKAEYDAKQQLYSTLKELEDKNQVLSFVSTTDSLTGLFNRRGFMERAMEMVNTNIEKRAAVFFSDLDHLKEINDVFGHSDGDFALINASAILKETVHGFRSEGTVCGRIGGDEFVSLMICDQDSDADKLLALLKDRINAFNESCEKPYYVEFSTGCFLFTCTEGYSLVELTAQADNCLYEAKKQRRQSIIKS